MGGDLPGRRHFLGFIAVAALVCGGLAMRDAWELSVPLCAQLLPSFCLYDVCWAAVGDMARRALCLAPSPVYSLQCPSSAFLRALARAAVRRGGSEMAGDARVRTLLLKQSLCCHPSGADATLDSYYRLRYRCSGDTRRASSFFFCAGR